MQVTLLGRRATFVAVVVVLSCSACGAQPPSWDSGFPDPDDQLDFLSSDAYLMASVEPSVVDSTSPSSSMSSSSSKSSVVVRPTVNTSVVRPTLNTSVVHPTVSLNTSVLRPTLNTSVVRPTVMHHTVIVSSMSATAHSSSTTPTSPLVPSPTPTNEPPAPTGSAAPTSDTPTQPVNPQTSPHPSAAVKTNTEIPQPSAVVPPCPSTSPVPVGDCTCQKTLGLSLGISIPCTAIVAVLTTSLFFIYCQKAAKKKNSYVRMAPTVYFDEEEQD